HPGLVDLRLGHDLGHAAQRDQPVRDPHPLAPDQMDGMPVTALEFSSDAGWRRPGSLTHTWRRGDDLANVANVKSRRAQGAELAVGAPGRNSKGGTADRFHMPGRLP